MNFITFLQDNGWRLVNSACGAEFLLVPDLFAWAEVSNQLFIGGVEAAGELRYYAASTSTARRYGKEDEEYRKNKTVDVSCKEIGWRQFAALFNRADGRKAFAGPVWSRVVAQQCGLARQWLADAPVVASACWTMGKHGVHFWGYGERGLPEVPPLEQVEPEAGSLDGFSAGMHVGNYLLRGRGGAYSTVNFIDYGMRGPAARELLAGGIRSDMRFSSEFNQFLRGGLSVPVDPAWAPASLSCPTAPPEELEQLMFPVVAEIGRVCLRTRRVVAVGWDNSSFFLASRCKNGKVVFHMLRYDLYRRRLDGNLRPLAAWWAGAGAAKFHLAPGATKDDLVAVQVTCTMNKL